ncbi:hypothetical protein ACIOMM_03465 [Streptomyces sp. NPDC087908]|uniref:hypothetical protein n=1 Tax=unclassified Streptomyces TaxID=2593676 RepID=UPI0011CD9869|nr:hypothetical protein [Streptomyces sp. adm13(2018)]TXS20004.1 hypothetical protein EAO70_09595 [Streptomyces sp. adm13(2018)]
MNEHERSHRPSRTTPAEAEGESGDREAREKAEDAVQGRAGDTDREGTDGHRAKRQSPGIGREEQTEQQPGQQS